MAAVAKSTRSSTAKWLIGQPISMLSHFMLPTILEVLKCFFFRHEVKGLSIHESSVTVIKSTCEIWEKAKIPTIRKDNAVTRLEKFHKEYTDLLKDRNKKSAVARSKVTDFEKRIMKLFDIAPTNVFDLIKIAEDRDFLIDQRDDRNMVLGSIDKDDAEKEENKVCREISLDKRLQKEALRKQHSEEVVVLENSTSPSSSASSDHDDIVVLKGKDDVAESSGLKRKRSIKKNYYP